MFDKIKYVTHEYRWLLQLPMNEDTVDRLDQLENVTELHKSFFLRTAPSHVSIAKSKWHDSQRRINETRKYIR